MEHMATNYIVRIRNMTDGTISGTFVVTEEQGIDLCRALGCTSNILEVEKHSGMLDWAYWDSLMTHRVARGTREVTVAGHTYTFVKRAK